MNDVLARAARDFEDDALRRQDITKDTENEVRDCVVWQGHIAEGRSSSARVRRAEGRRIAYWASQSENERPLVLPAASRVGPELHRDLSVFQRSQHA